ncbi:tautomerase family protein [Comamonas testosteroni]|uniref:tautomerase family protein n=1 Tax=Comamonas testosteroni TaxID=285 RepID=UPI003D14D449
MAAVRFTDLQEPAKHKRFGGVIRQAADTVLSKATGYFGQTDHACIETEGRYVLSVQWETLGDHTVALVGPFCREMFMPEIVVYAAEGRSHEQKQELMQKIASAVKETLASLWTRSFGVEGRKQTARWHSLQRASSASKQLGCPLEK